MLYFLFIKHYSFFKNNNITILLSLEINRILVEFGQIIEILHNHIIIGLQNLPDKNYEHIGASE
jgi:hypothetical protein